MAWKYPKTRSRIAQPMDLDALNENFENVVQELQGNLNEHNWAANAFTDAEDYAQGAVLRVRQAVSEVVPMAAGVGPPVNIGSVVSGTPYQTQPDFEWGQVVLQTVRTDATVLWMMASFQHSVSSPAGTIRRSGIQYALRLDGTVLTETITGSGERATDTNGEGYDGDGTNMAFVIDAVIPVTAGPHQVELVARMTSGVALNLQYLSDDDYWMILNRELLIVEMY
jgi:hypothetical protein